MEVNIIFTGQMFKKVYSGTIHEGIIPDPELGYYKSKLALVEAGYDISKYIELDLMLINPSRFEKLPSIAITQPLHKETILFRIWGWLKKCLFNH